LLGGGGGIEDTEVVGGREEVFVYFFIDEEAEGGEGGFGVSESDGADEGLLGSYYRSDGDVGGREEEGGL